MAEQLLPCPFCGPGQSVVSAWLDDVSNRWRVGCGRCGCSTGIHTRDESEAPAIAAWNRRASPWRPIETAPRDGTRVLLATKQGVQFVGKYTDAESRFPWHRDYTDTYFAKAQLSGWQPLPAAPEVRND